MGKNSEQDLPPNVFGVGNQKTGSASDMGPYGIPNFTTDETEKEINAGGGSINMPLTEKEGFFQKGK